MANYHIVKDDEGKWKVVKIGSERASGKFASVHTASKSARRLVKNSGGGDVRIHGADGRIKSISSVPEPRKFKPTKIHRTKGKR